ncbi:tetratricopeptide repeat protein [Nodosilinea sp. LEGE 07088]|uniref:tetratricopeptide repeat protein n=1 Tax=Nodosilinea sp. LEGE 07088 TaxID=2777968 RepID=UPI00187F0DD3|nr:tetratricopeptide repeat protein [Nodosilinea sp. LEGE 07088]MBE9138127.1 tetratricopeptide repeat protein [Nodosilinea sp. LEGE 07088]
MVTVAETNLQPLSAPDHEELSKLVNEVALSETSLTLYAIAPESAPDHPVVEALRAELRDGEEPLQFLNFFYSDNSLFNFLADLDNQAPPAMGRRVVLAFGLEQLPKPRLKQELEQLNLAREKIFEQGLVLVFWLNQERFLDEFRNRAPDFWDWRGRVARFETRHPLLYPYLEWLIADNAYLTMSGVMQVNRQVDIFLDQIYVSLQAERRQQVAAVSKHQRASVGKVASLRQASPSSRSSQEEDLEPDFAPAPELEIESSVSEVETSTTKTVTETVDLADVVRGSYSCSVILGAPGAGKTTLLKYLALHFAKALRDKQDIVQGGTEQEKLGETRWPIYFKIADYAERLETHPELGLLDYLQQFYRNWEDYFDGDDEASALSSRLLERMQGGNCLILLDGLDEVFDQESRRQIVGRINDFAEQFGHNKLIVTSRIAGYQEVKLASRFTEFTITDMNDVQVSDFLHRWCRAVEKAQKPDATAEQQERAGDRQAEQILSDIQRSEGVKRLTTNPLLLTILALIHRNGEQLPARRVKLYELAVQTLTADWQLSKKLPNMQKVLLPEGEVVELLAPLAYWMHEEKPSGQVTHAELNEQLAPRLAALRGEASDSPEILGAVEEFLRRVRETTGLFVERAPDVYGFMHLTFEEYFAARDIADRDREEMLETIQQHWREPRWVEPILLALGYYGNHSPSQLNRLFEKLFEGLVVYQPVPGQDDIKLLGGDSPDAQIQWFKADNPSQKEAISLKELLFAGQVIAEVAEVNANPRKKLIYQLICTGLALAIDADDAEKAIVKQILQLLRQIEQFHQRGEVVEALRQFSQNATLSREMRLKAQVATFYVVCGEAGPNLADCVSELVEGMEPDLFCALRDLVNDLGAEISPNLELLSEHQELVKGQHSLAFITAMSYVREKHYDKAVALFEALSEAKYSLLSPYAAWSLATCHQEKEDYEKANDFYQTCFEQLADFIEPNAFLVYWRNRGICQRLHEKYEQSLNCFQQMLTIAREILRPQEEASALYHLGKTYQDWGKYAEAIAHYEQSQDRYQQLEKESDVAKQWYWMAVCYHVWGRYEQALTAAQQELSFRQKLNEPSRIALAYYLLGHIYQGWGKYGEAVAHYEQSCDRYQQLEKESDVANQWYWMAVCYRKWDHYKQALEAEKQDLALRQKLDDQPNIALAYYQLGRIYQGWGKYGEAIAHYEQSRDRYQQLEKDTDVANQWYWMAVCYREWGKYRQALDAEQRALALRQKLDDQPGIADAYWQLGRIYQAWGKYAEAIAHYEQSRDLYKQLEKDSNVADLWYWKAICYREWGRYEQALEAEQQDLALRQKLDDQPGIADAYWQLGRIYQAWGKYEEAIAYHEQSRDRYQQLEKGSDVANLFFWIGDSYKDWGQYEQAIESHRRCLELRQLEAEPSRLALSLYQLGQIYQAWGKYDEAITHYEQSRDRYQNLGKQKEVSCCWYNLAGCYREWSQYEQALQCERQDLELCQKLDLQEDIALAYHQLGRIYHAWGKYKEAIAYHQQSLDLYRKLDLQQAVANQFSWIASCYRDLKDYPQAIKHYQSSLEKHQTLGYTESAVWRLQQLANTQRLQVKDSPREVAILLLQSAESNLQQAIDLGTANDYRQNLAYDQIALALLIAERLRWLPATSNSIPEHITQFEQAVADGFARLNKLGQTVDRADEALDIARAYLEIEPLANLDKAEELTQEALKTLQDFNRRKLQAAANKLLGEIYIARARRSEPSAASIAAEFLTTSLTLYRELDVSKKATEVEQLIAGLQDLC